MPPGAVVNFCNRKATEALEDMTIQTRRRPRL